MSHSSSQTLPALEIAKLAVKALDDKKAEELHVLHVSRQSSITDYLVVATGTSEPHLRALRVELEKVLDAAKVRILGMDTEQGSGWLVVDAFDVMVHLFTKQTREVYRLEQLWKDAEEISVARLLGQPEPVKPAKPVKEAPKKAKKAKKEKAVVKRTAGSKTQRAKKPNTLKKAPKAGKKPAARKKA